MRRPEFITFTGLDDRTDLKRADELANKYPIEWGLLFSHKNSDARYASSQTLAEATEIAGKKSVHLCGSAAREYPCLPKPVLNIFSSVDRMQLNGVKPLCHAKHCHVDLIFQKSEFDFITKFQLFDVSGGRGEFPCAIPSPKTNGLVGYAGGMGPNTVIEYLRMINCENPFWIDMESNIRTNGWFDLDKVERVCELVF